MGGQAIGKGSLVLNFPNINETEITFMQVFDSSCFMGVCDGNFDANDEANADYINAKYNSNTYEGKAVTSYMNTDSGVYTEYELVFDEKAIYRQTIEDGGAPTTACIDFNGNTHLKSNTIPTTNINANTNTNTNTS